MIKSFKCKVCGFEQIVVRNPHSKPGRVVCQNCHSIIVKKLPEPQKPKHDQEYIWILNKYATHCRKCRDELQVGSNVLWIPGKRGVLCKYCGYALEVKMGLESPLGEDEF